MRLAVIPARGGSKRIPRKNVRPFAGRPMIAHAVAAAFDSGCFDHVVVSTDDAEIGEVARRYGAETPFVRPAALAGDHVPTRPVVIHAIEAVAALCGMPDLVCCIYATAPFLTGAILSDACARIEQGGAEFVFSCAAFAYPIQRGFRLLPGGGAERLWPEHRLTRSQDLEPAYHDAGQFYWGRSEAFLADRDPISAKAHAYVLPAHRVQDIDTPEDWIRAELMFRALAAETEGAAA